MPQACRAYDLAKTAVFVLFVRKLPERSIFCAAPASANRDQST